MLWCLNNPIACKSYTDQSRDNELLSVLIAEVSGYADAKACSQGSVAGCALTAVGFVPIGKLKVLAGLGKLGKAFKIVDDAPWAGTFCFRSFTADTEVLMADGTTKPIGDIKPEDQVWASDPVTGESGPREVTAVWAHDDSIVLLEVDGQVIETTEDHPFWNATDQQWQRADQLDTDDTLQTTDGSRIAVTGIIGTLTTAQPAYNLTIADIHTYYVLAGNTPVLVHNVGCDDWADAFIELSGGQKATFRPPHGGRVFPEGTYANQPPGEAWFHHTVVVRDGKVFDQWNPNGISIAEYKAQWGDIADDIDFGF